MSLPSAFPAHPWSYRVTSEAPRAPTGAEDSEVLPGRARIRSVMPVALGAVVLAAVWLIPALALRPLAEPVLLALPVGVAVGIGVDLIRAAGTVTRSRREFSAHSRYLTVSTWTGLRTIDLRGLKRVRAQRSVSRTSKTTYLTVTDTAGVHVVFRAPRDIKAIRRALETGMQGAEPVKVSRLARGVLGTQPLPGWLSALWTLGSAGLSVLIVLGGLITVSALAGM
jgi:hypothetical protein